MLSPDIPAVRPRFHPAKLCDRLNWSTIRVCLLPTSQSPAPIAPPSVWLTMRNRPHSGLYRVHRICWLHWALLLAVGICPVCAVDSSGYFAAMESIRSVDLQNHVNVLADDAMEGRNAGAGGRAAADYLAKYLAQTRLKPGGTDGGYLQPFGRDCQNVLGVIEGSDAALKQEYILVGTTTTMSDTATGAPV